MTDLAARLDRIVGNAGTVTIFDMLVSEHRVTCDRGAECETPPIVQEAQDTVREAAIALREAEAKVEALERQNTTLFDSHDEEYREYEARIETLTLYLRAVIRAQARLRDPRLARIWRNDHSECVAEGGACPACYAYLLELTRDLLSDKPVTPITREDVDGLLEAIGRTPATPRSLRVEADSESD